MLCVYVGDVMDVVFSVCIVMTSSHLFLFSSVNQCVSRLYLSV